MRIYLLLFSLLFVGTVLVPDGVGSGSDVVLIPVFLVVGVAFFGRIASLRVLADESGLHVRNFLRTQHAAWAMGGYVDDATPEVNSALILHWNGRHWSQG